ncbi:MAG: sulfatase [Planctomycetes bacterium]|nr:sulfatase [Planctomycetota bacterium]
MPAPAPEAPRASPGAPVTLVVGLSVGFHFACFLLCLFGLYRFTRELDNDFARAAREEHVGFTLRVNAGVLPLYALLAAAAAVLLYPLVAALRTRGWNTGRIAAAFLLALTSLHGVAAFRFYQLHPQFIDGPVGNAYKWLWQHLPWWGQRALAPAVCLALLGVGGAASLAWYGVGLARACRRLAPPARLRCARVAGAAVALALGLAVAAVAARPAHGRDGRSPEGSGGGRARPNVLILASDSLRADHLGMNGYARPTSPRLDAWAKKAVNFRQAYVPVASTLESWVSFLTAQYPHTHGIRQMFPARAEMDALTARSPLLPVLFRGAGYRTAVLGDWCASIFHLADFGFDEVEATDWQNFAAAVLDATVRGHLVLPWYFHSDLGHHLYPALRDSAKFTSPQDIVGRVRRRLRAFAAEERPFFLVCFLSSTHLPYSCYDAYHDLFCDPAYDGPFQYRLNFAIDKFIQGKSDFVPTEADMRRTVDLYDGCVRSFDDCAGDVLDELARLGLDANTLVAVTSDHGDDLYEPGVNVGHGVTFLGGDQENRVPFVLRVPGLAPRVVERLVRSIDLAPTLLDFAGLPIPGTMEGVTLRPYLTGAVEDLGLVFHGETSYLLFQRKTPGVEPVELPRLDRMVSIDPDYDHNLVLREEARAWVSRTKERAIRTDRWKLVAIPTRNGEVVKLFDLAKDPGQQEDLAGRGLPVEAELRRRLRRWEEEHVEERWK